MNMPFIPPRPSARAMAADDEAQASEDSEADYTSCIDVDDNYDSSKPNSPTGIVKQIAVDPLSLNRVSGAVAITSGADAMHTRPKFVSCSLPGSALSSPKFGSAPTKTSKKWKNAQRNPAVSSLARQHSAALSRFALEQRMSLRRSKSCGEGRSSAPADDFIDILSGRPSVERYSDGTFVADEPTDEESVFRSSRQSRSQGDQRVKCGCLFLPGLSPHKKKQVTPRASQGEFTANHVKDEDEEGREKCRVSSVSRAVSLEKFDCGSWTSSSPNTGGGDGGEGTKALLELPLELIRSGQNDTDSPVTAAFVFDKEVKGVLKKSTSRLSSSRSQGSSNRHVRFSTSAPISHPASPSSACVTPRLRKARAARAEFNAFLEAQSA